MYILIGVESGAVVRTLTVQVLWSLHVFLMNTQVSSRCAGFLPYSQDKHRLATLNCL